MTKEQTLSMIKPDAVQRNLIGPIISLIEASNLVIKQMKMLQLSIEQAENFYRIHKDRDFYSKLIEYMTSGCVVVLALEGDNAIKVYRDLILYI